MYNEPTDGNASDETGVTLVVSFVQSNWVYRVLRVCENEHCCSVFCTYHQHSRLCFRLSFSMLGARATVSSHITYV